MVWSNNEIRNGYRVRGIWQACHIALCVIKLGRVQVLYKGNGVWPEMLIMLLWFGEGGGLQVKCLCKGSKFLPI